ncbi:phage portal protein [Virgibacillus sp. MG-45]|uniref:phage portal protein n=1 Tax=Virgibacillus sp. MG-45 TaxID=3102791 RepID=UPI002EDADB51
MGFLGNILKRNSEIDLMLDINLIEDTSNRIQMKKLAIQTCINFISRTISMSEFRIRDGDKSLKGELYYRLNVRPNINQSAATFWQQVIYKLIYDNECLIIQSDTQDLLVADSFTRVKYAVYGDVFKDVIIKDHEFKRSFKREDVLYLEYSNEKLTPLLDGLYKDYGELFGRIVDAQKRKNQIRGTVDVNDVLGKDPKTTERLQTFIDKLYNAFSKKDIAVVPQQKGFAYQEHSKETKAQSVEEVDKVADGFLKQVARALNIPPALILGEMADIEKPTRNYMLFCIDPFIKSIGDEFNGQLFTRTEYFNGKKMDIRRPSYRDIFDVAAAVDKLRASGVANGNDLRDKLGWEEVDNPILERYYITKNYTDDLEGGENE